MAEKKPVRVGVIGLGFMGATHVNAYQKAASDGAGCELTAVCDVDPKRRSGDLAGVPGQIETGAGTRAFDPAKVRGYEKAEDLLADPNVDLVSICTHTTLHVEMAEKAMRAGKDVVVEKPVAVEADAIAGLARVAQETGRLCMPAMCIRFWPQWAWLKRQVAEGTYGKLLGVSFMRMGGAPGWSPSFFLNGKLSGGAIIDLHLHDADFACWLLGMPSEVSSAGFCGPSGCIDRVTSLYRYASPDAPRLVTTEASWEHVGFGFRMRYVATFERATADYDVSRPDPLTVCTGGKVEPVKLEDLTGYDLELRAAVRAVATGDRSGLPTLAEAEAVTRVIDAERESALTGKTVTV